MKKDVYGERLCSGGARHNRVVKGRSPRYARDDGRSYVGLGLGPAAYLAKAYVAEGASTTRFAPSIMTPSVRRIAGLSSAFRPTKGSQLPRHQKALQFLQILQIGGWVGLFVALKEEIHSLRSG